MHREEMNYDWLSKIKRARRKDAKDPATFPEWVKEKLIDQGWYTPPTNQNKKETQ